MMMVLQIIKEKKKQVCGWCPSLTCKSTGKHSVKPAFHWGDVPFEWDNDNKCRYSKVTGDESVG